jgi:hypothetical protein
MKLQPFGQLQSVGDSPYLFDDFERSIIPWHQPSVLCYPHNFLPNLRS